MRACLSREPPVSGAKPFPSVPLLEKTIGELRREAARRYPENDAVVSCHQKLRVTCRELEDETDRVAAGA